MGVYAFDRVHDDILLRQNGEKLKEQNSWMLKNPNNIIINIFIYLIIDLQDNITKNPIDHFFFA